MKTFGFAGYSGSGKTTLIEQLIPRFVKQGLRVSLIKHAHHAFDVDQPGKDSYRHRHAGAGEVLVTSSRRWVLMHELRGEPEPSFEAQLEHLSPCDLLLVEGFKHAPIPKLEVWRAVTGEGLLHPSVKKADGMTFVDWLVSPEGQKAIAGYRIDGQELFFPNAKR